VRRDCSLAGRLRSLPEKEIDRILRTCSDEEIAALEWAGEFWLRPDEREPGSVVGSGQTPPPGDWMWWVLQGGRGAGKSFGALSWARDEGERLGAGCVFLFTARTAEDARKNLVEGESGILSLSPSWLGLDFKPSVDGGLLTWKSGAIAYLLGVDKPGAGRGGNFNRWLIDDVAAFGPNAKKTFDALSKAFRLRTPDGSGLRACVTTTPPGDPPPGCPELLEFFLDPQFKSQKQFVYSIDKSDVNFQNLDPGYRHVLELYTGAAEQAERGGVYDRSAALRVFRDIEFGAAPIKVDAVPGKLRRVAVWIDPSVSSATKACEVGIVAVGELEDGRAIVLEDASGHYTARDWPERAIDCLERWEPLAPGHFGVETNRGEAQAEALLSMAIDLRRQTARAENREPRSLVRIEGVHSNRTKTERGDLLVAYYRAGNIFHLTGLAEVEAQLRALSSVRKQGPGYDRADAAIYGLLDMFRILDKVRPGAIGVDSVAPLMPAGSTQAGGFFAGPERPQQPSFQGFTPPSATANTPGVFGRSSF
jgi:phage terminase large subunit-like protein